MYFVDDFFNQLCVEPARVLVKYEVSYRKFRARGIMSSPPITISSDRSVEDAATLMLDRNFMPERSLVPLMRGEVFRVMGVQVQSGGHLQEAIDHNRHRKLGDVAEVDAPTALPDSTASELAGIMLNRRVSHVPVVEDGRPAGMVSRHDFLRMFAAHRD